MKKIDKKEALKDVEKIGKQTIEDYKKFALKGNVLDLAIGVVLGGAFTNIVNSLVTGIITPFLGILTNKVDLSSLYVSLTGGVFKSLDEAKASGALVLNYGLLLNAILNFVIVSVVLFMIIKNLTRFKKKENIEEVKTQKECPYCKSSINVLATRCPNCTSILEEKEDEKIKKPKIQKV